MKNRFNKVLSMICIMTMLMSCFTVFSVQAADDVEIITAQYLAYDGEIRVLADIPSGYEAKLILDGTEIAATIAKTDEGTLLSAANFTPTAYGIVPVTVKAANGTEELSDTENIEIVKAFSKAISFAEDFNTLDEMTMTDAEDTSVADAVKALNGGQLTLSAIPTSSYNGRYAAISKAYTDDESSALTMRFEATADRGLPTLVADPSSDGTDGIIELSYDFYTTSANIRQTINPVSRAYNSAMTFVTEDGASYATSFRAVNFENYCFGSSDKTVEANKWYNIRFVTNLNDLTFEFYVNNELINHGYFTYNDSRIGKYIYGIQKFNLAAGVQGVAGASEENPVDVAFDNIKITHTNIGASVSDISYTLAGATKKTDILNAEVAPGADSVSVAFDNVLSCTSDDITLTNEEGAKVDADVAIETGDALSAKANRTVITISPKQPFEVEENYIIVLSENVKFGSNAFGTATQITFKAGGTPIIMSPADGSGIKYGDVINLKAYIPSCESADLYINGEYITELYGDDKNCIAYAYDTSADSVGKKTINFVLSKYDGTYETLSSEVYVSPADKTDIIPLETFDNTVADGYFSVVKQASAASASMVQTEIEGRKAAGFYFVANTGTNRKVIQVQKSVAAVQTGRVALEFDMYIAQSNSNAELSISFGDGTYTFYPLDVAKQFSKGKIGGIATPYSGWHKVKLVMDTIDQSSEIYLDGNQIGDTCYTFDSTYHKSGVEDPESITGFKAFTISLWQGHSCTSGSEYLGFAVDNWHVYQEKMLPAFESVSTSEALYDGQLIDATAKAFSVAFANAKYCDTASLVDNFKLRANGEAVEIKNAAFENGTLTFNVDALSENADIELVIGANTVLCDGTSTLGADCVFALKTADANGLYSKRIITLGTSEAKASFKLDSLTEKSIAVVIAGYNGNKLETVDIRPVTIDGAKNLSLSLSKAGLTEVKAFVWSGADTLIPLSAGEVSAQLS